MRKIEVCFRAIRSPVVKWEGLDAVRSRKVPVGGHRRQPPFSMPAVAALTSWAVRALSAWNGICRVVSGPQRRATDVWQFGAIGLRRARWL